jgi:DNA repair protein RadA/Sms
MSYPCAFCNHVIKEGKVYCPSCKKWNWSHVISKEETETVLLSNVQSDSTPRIHTEFLDPVFGGGIAQTSVNLIGGAPGGGKTTLNLQIIDSIVEHYQREALYIANEQSPEEIAETAKRICVQNLKLIRIYKAMGGLKRTLDEIYREFKPCIVVLDSLSKLVGDDLSMSIRVSERTKDLSVEMGCPTMIINQVNKEGDYAGLKKLEHVVDGTFMLDKDDTTGERFFYSTKNRFGEAPKGIELRMTPALAPIPGKLEFVKELDI